MSLVSIDSDKLVELSLIAARSGEVLAQNRKMREALEHLSRQLDGTDVYVRPQGGGALVRVFEIARAALA